MISAALLLSVIVLAGVLLTIAKVRASRPWASKDQLRNL